MAHLVETMAYAGETPWHGLGERVSADMTPKQMLKAAHLDWKVGKKPMFFTGKNGKPVETTTHALVRESDGSLLSVVGANYKPVQNEDALDFFSKFTEAGSMTMETAGSLADGKFVWALAKVTEDFAIGKGDMIKPYLLLMSPHVFGKSLIMQYTPTRVVCWNTLQMALGDKLEGGRSRQTFRVPHSQSFKVKKEEAQTVFATCMEQNKAFKEAAKFLASKKATKEKVDEFFYTLLDFDPRKADKEGGRVPLMLPKFQEALVHAPGQQLATAAGTWFGAVGAVTYVVDHESGSSNRQTALRNAWVGRKSRMKRDALSLALEMAS